MRALDWLARRFGYVRPAQRARYGYDAAQLSRLTASLQAQAEFINTTLRYQLRILRARARQAAQNNPFARRFVQMVVDNVCGAEPFGLEGKVRNRKGAFDESANDEIETCWEGWGKAGQCEVGGRWSWNTIQRLLARNLAVDGELLVRKLRGPEWGPYGYKLQVIDVDRLWEYKSEALDNGGAIHAGVEVDPYGKAVAYHIIKRKPAQWQWSGYTLEFERVPADEIIHVFVPEFAEQIRGIPWMYAALLNLVHMGAFEEAAVIAARIGAANMGFIESPDGGRTLADMAGAGPNRDGTDALGGNNGDPQISAEPGTFPVLPTGYKFNGSWNPKYPDAAVEPFVKAMLRGIGAGLGVAYHNLANDLENVNYSSARIGELDERDSWKGLQTFWCEHINQPLYEDWLRMQLMIGTLPFPIEKIERYKAVYWQARRWAWVDPLKEVGAAIEAVNARITSRTRIAAENGVDLEDVFDEIAAENKMAADKGVQLEIIQPKATGIVPPAQDQGAGTAATEGAGEGSGDGGGDGSGDAGGDSGGNKGRGNGKKPRWRDSSRGADA